MKLLYTTNNAYNCVVAVYPDHAEWFRMDGSEEFPIIGSAFIREHPEYEQYCGKYGPSQFKLPALEKAAEDYLRSIVDYFGDWNWYESEAEPMDDESEEEFVARILGEDEILAELEI